MFEMDAMVRADVLVAMVPGKYLDRLMPQNLLQQDSEGRRRSILFLLFIFYEVRLYIRVCRGCGRGRRGWLGWRHFDGLHGSALLGRAQDHATLAIE